MSAQDEIERREAEIRALKARQQSCQHQWGEPFYDPYTSKKEVLTGRYESHGIHQWPITKMVDERKDRWTQVCQKCGQKRHTEKQKEVSVQRAPDFG